MQGIKNAKKPPASPAMKIPHKDCACASWPLSLIEVIAVLSVGVSAVSVPSVKTKSSGTSTNSCTVSSSDDPSVNSTPSVEIKLSCCAKDGYHRINSKKGNMIKRFKRKCITQFLISR